MSQPKKKKEHPCDLLGIPRESTVEEARKARLELVRRGHVDSKDYDPSAGDLLIRVNSYFSKWEKCIREGKPFILEPELPEEEDPFADLEKKKSELRNKAQAKYESRNGEDIHITRRIDLDAAIKKGELQISVVGELKTSTAIDQKYITVRIPANLVLPATLRLKGKGKPGLFGGTSGDLYVKLIAKVQEKPAPPPPPPPPPPSPHQNLYPMPPIRREDISPVVTPVRNLGKQFWWKLGIAIVLVFMISKAMSTSDDSGIDNQYPDQEQSQVIDQTTASDETGTNDPYIYDPYSIEENSDASGNFEPDSAQTDVLSQEESGIDAGATGDLGNP